MVLRNTLSRFFHDFEMFIVPFFENLSKCTACDIGLRCDQQGLKEPETCPVGYHCKNTMEITVCPAGSYQNQTNSDFCKQCELGHWCPYSGMTKPSPCPIGTYQDEKGQFWCKGCPRRNKCLEGMNQNEFSSFK